MEKDKTTIIERVRKLLALATSSNEHEAALAAAHAQRLLAEHNLAMTDIEASQETMAANKVDINAAKTFPKWIQLLLAGVSEAFDCQAFHYRSGKIIFIGVGADAQVAAYTFTYLQGTIRRLCRDYMKNHPSQGFMSPRKTTLVRNSYFLGAALTVFDALMKQKEETPVTTGALVPVKDALIKSAVNELGKVRTIKTRKSYVDSEAFDQGQKDGATVSIQRGVGNEGSPVQAAIGM
ncbi:MAG: hypothetical protein ACD_74C00157G0002 [uncultured bacterium]|jgi:hypothetical protein|nr:MAG: hypothetical protein ACD_74C00157G0002 [uncultured bacterium]